MTDQEYTSPFSTRYVSAEMSSLFSLHHRTILWRKLWVALAQAQRHLGLPIQKHQVEQMQQSMAKINWENIRKYEKTFRHDVMAHIHAFGDLCPRAKAIIHLGATSTYVTDNGDLIQMKEALQLLHRKLLFVLRSLKGLAHKYAKNPCLGFTHYQSAQPTTIGKRMALWLQDFLFDAQQWERLIKTLPFLGAKGATGTQSSFLSLFHGDEKKVEQLEEKIAKEFGFRRVIAVSGQTYSRKLDLTLLNAFESFAASSHKMATDIRLLAHDGEMVEAFDKTQVGSSAMPYKRNPIYSERICGIARFVMALAQNSAYTTATQWLERTLDDSSNKRLAVPEAFLGTDAILNLLIHILGTLRVDPKRALQRLKEESPHLAMENILMAAVNKGGDRQKLHEKLRKKREGSVERLMEEIVKDPEFGLKKEEIKPLFAIDSLIGRAPSQVFGFLKKDVDPYLSKHRGEKLTPSPVAI